MKNAILTILLLIILINNLYGQFPIDTLSKIKSLLENNSWQIQSIEPKINTKEFFWDFNLLDTNAVYSFGKIFLKENSLKGSYIIGKKSVRGKETIMHIFTDGPAYFFTIRDLKAINIIYDDNDFFDEIAELNLNDNIFSIKRIYKDGRYPCLLIRFKKF